MRQILAITLIILSINTLYTQTKKSKDITSIKKMCGCFEISFDFAETFIKTENKNYKKSKNYSKKEIEWAK